MKITRLSLILYGLLLAISSIAQDWPDWRGNGRTGIWNETGIINKFKSDTIPLKWSVPCGPGYSGPTISGGKVYLTDLMTKPEPSERVLCYDARDGKLIWSYSYPCLYENVGYQNGPRASVVSMMAKPIPWGLWGIFTVSMQRMALYSGSTT